jgi:hypothetical protein
MKIPQWLKVVCLFVMLVSTVSAQDTDTPRSPFVGDGVDGSGPSCYGTLRIYPKTLTWTAGHSKCVDVPYETLEFKKDGDKVHAVYRLKAHERRCMYRVIVLDASDQYIYDHTRNWDVTGYTSFRAYKLKDQIQYTGCGLY